MQVTMSFLLYRKLLLIHNNLCLNATYSLPLGTANMHAECTLFWWIHNHLAELDQLLMWGSLMHTRPNYTHFDCHLIQCTED